MEHKKPEPIMDRKAGDFLTAFLNMTENNESSELYRKWVCLSVLAAGLGRRCHVIHDKKIYPNLYVVLVGPAANSRKGTAMGPGLELMRMEDTINLTPKSITREALIREMKECNSQVVDAEGIAHRHHSITIWSEEWTVFVGRGNQALIDNLTDWYDCPDIWDYKTKHFGEDVIHGMYVNMLGATTPSMIQSALPPEAIGGGLTSRTIFVYSDGRERLIPNPYETDEIRRLRECLVTDLQIISSLSGEFKQTKEFYDLRTDWYISQSKPENIPFRSHRFDSYLGRRPTHLFKIAMLLSASRDNNMILDGDIFRESLSLLTETEIRMPNIYRGYGLNPMAPISEGIRRHVQMKGEVPYVEILRMFVSDAEPTEISTAVNTLQKIGYIQMEQRGEHMFLKHRCDPSEL